MSEHNNTLGILYAVHILLKQGALLSQSSTYIMRSFIL